MLRWPSTEPEMMLPVDRTVIMGHVPQRKAVDTGELIALDTGAGTCAPWKLTAVILPERRFVSVER